MAFPSGWGRRAPIVIDAVEDALTNFPVHLDVDCFPAEALDSGHANKALSDGADLRFSTDTAGSDDLPFEIVRWVQHASAGSRKANVHVRVPALSQGSTTTIYVWYKNASATMPAATDANGSRAVWDSSYAGVWHINSTSSIPNSTGGTAATIEGSPSTTVEGPLGLALDFDGTDDALDFGSANYNDDLWEVVLKCDSTADQIIMGKSTGGSYSRSVWVNPVPSDFFDTDGSLGYQATFADNANASTSNWEYWASRSRSTAGAGTSRALPATETTHGSHANDGTYLYVIGGHTGTPASPLTTHKRYDPSGNSWSTLTALPAARWGCTAVCVSGKLYVIGGNTDASTASTRLDIYDIAGDSWSAGATVPSAVAGQGQSACTDGTYIYVLYGANLERYSIAGNSWATMANKVGTAATWVSLICAGGYIYAIGGGSTALNGVYRYTISGDAWDGSLYDTAPYAAWAHVCEPVGDGTWLIGFGRNGTTEQSTRLYVYNPATKAWTRKPGYDMPTNAAAAAVLGGKLYIYGYWVIGKLETYSAGHHARYDISGSSWDTSPPVADFCRDGVWISGQISATAVYAGTGKLYLGRQDAYGALYSGAQFAEFRRSSSARSRAWIKATRETLIAASSFVAVGSPVDAAPEVNITAVYADSVTASSVVPRVTLDFA